MSENKLEKKSVSMCKSSDWAAGYNECVDIFGEIVEEAIHQLRLFQWAELEGKLFCRYCGEDKSGGCVSDCVTTKIDSTLNGAKEEEHECL